MILSERKIKILEAIINDYIQSAEPIGSRTIAKKYELGISSATIRNEMSDLEEMGLINQPHASSGRVPSDKGYRLYVDQLMPNRDLSEDETVFLRKIVQDNIKQIDYMMQETAKAISMLTNYPTIISEPVTQRTSVKHIQLVPIDERTAYLVLVTDSKAVKNHTLHLDGMPGFEVLNSLSLILNRALAELDPEDFDDSLFRELLGRTGFDKLILAIKTAILDVVRSEDNMHIYTSGVRNILAFPEFNDLEKAKAVFQALEEREVLITILGRDSSENIRVMIGDENNLEQLKNCSIIKANYMLGDHSHGSIGIIGPTRMDYSQTMSVLRGIVKHINSVISALTGG